LAHILKICTGVSGNSSNPHNPALN
jgi:hypothetical protein